ncbi:ArsR/SmtB family transcription factor [Aestuariibius sp. HNIBRBA575]|uniref:ArsR/SmtB family transcription factor n=1 Tax=Aestuariibius sp. HNIBRBA575 TaxID=3233343 RepID=UPI0034A38A8F
MPHSPRSETHPPDVFKALADPTRRSILKILSGNEMTIAQVAGNFDMTRAAVKKHLNILNDGGLITTRAAGREVFNALSPHGLQPVRDWLGYFDQFWDDALSDLKSAIETDLPQSNPKTTSGETQND